MWPSIPQNKAVWNLVEKGAAMKLAPCGLNCDKCSLKPDKCDGCHAESEHLWHADCPIRVCCKFEKKQDDCSFCQSFPCSEILAFEADKWDHHTLAVRKLRNLKAEQDGNAGRSD